MGRISIYIRDCDSRILFLFENIDPGTSIADIISNFEERVKACINKSLFLRHRINLGSSSSLNNERYELMLPNIIDPQHSIKLDESKTLQEYKIQSKTTLLAKKK